MAAATATGSIVSGKHHAAIKFDNRMLGHRPEGRVVENRVADLPAGVTHDSVDSRHERQLTAARVVGPVGLGAHPLMESGSKDLHDDLAVALRDGVSEVLIAGRPMRNR